MDYTDTKNKPEMGASHSYSLMPTDQFLTNPTPSPVYTRRESAKRFAIKEDVLPSPLTLTTCSKNGPETPTNAVSPLCESVFKKKMV